MTLFGKRDSGEWVEARGIVTRLLNDDLDVERHQRFILTVGSGQTLLIAHNIDLGGRVPLGIGDSIGVRGLYEWSEPGGTVHWTHRDPLAQETGGFIEYRRRRYD